MTTISSDLSQSNSFSSTLKDEGTFEESDEDCLTEDLPVHRLSDLSIENVYMTQVMCKDCGSFLLIDSVPNHVNECQRLSLQLSPVDIHSALKQHPASQSMPSFRHATFATSTSDSHQTTFPSSSSSSSSSFSLPSSSIPSSTTTIITTITSDSQPPALNVNDNPIPSTTHNVLPFSLLSTIDNTTSRELPTPSSVITDSSSSSSPNLPSSSVASPTPTRRTPKLEELVFGKTIGEGAYASVKIAMDEQGHRYAVKILDKGKVVRRNEIESVFREKTILSRLNHPAVVHLYATAQDASYLFFVLELCEQGELFHQIKRVGRFDEDCARFYSAEILTGLEYIHQQGIVHRDIKPENILLDHRWHAKITDFGTAKDLRLLEADATSSDLVNSSFVGTSHYLSPELLNKDQISGSSDMWAFGCVIYQMLVGRPPFSGPTDYSIFVQIRENKVVFPAFISQHAVDLIRGLLHPDADQRTTAERVRAHPWFADFDWVTLHTRAPPPIRAPITVSESSVGAPLQDVVPAEPPVLRIYISGYENVTSGFLPYTNYTIKLSWPQRGLHWQIVQRYSDLLQLHQQLLKTDIDSTLIPRFPGKKFLNQMDPQFIEKRKLDLSKYLIGIFAIPQVIHFPFIQERFSIPLEFVELSSSFKK